jgi:RimJ/RimL family protein N-acetyltransferase
MADVKSRKMAHLYACELDLLLSKRGGRRCHGPLRFPRLCSNIVEMVLDLGDLHIRPWRKSDLEALLRHANNAKIAANLRDQFPHPYTRRDGVDYLNYVRTMEVPMAFAIELAGEPIGGVGFKLGTDIARLSVEMGYWVGEPFWGRGIASRAVTASSEWAFDGYKVVRIFATVFSHNRASIRVLEKSGFAPEGILRRSAIKNGEILDQIMYAKVR